MSAVQERDLCVRVRPGVPAAGLRRLEAAGLRPEVGSLDLTGVDALLCLLTDRLDAALLEAAPRLRIAANMAMGTDNIDREAARALGIAVSTTPGATTDATADLAFGLLLAVARHLVWGDRLVRAGGFTGWRPDLGLGLELRGRALGIVGAGRIGQAVAERARGFGLEVRFARRQGGVPLAELLETSDVVSLHVPLTAATRFSRKPFITLMVTMRAVTPNITPMPLTQVMKATARCCRGERRKRRPMVVAIPTAASGKGGKGAAEPAAMQPHPR